MPYQTAKQSDCRYTSVKALGRNLVNVTTSICGVMLAVFLAVGASHAEDNEGPVIGPKGGKLLENRASRAEFFIEKDNRITITFYDANLKPVPAGKQVVTVTAEPRAGKVVLELEEKNGALVSRKPLPKSGFFDEYQITVQIRESADAKPETFQIRFDLDVCSKCKHPEYACTCRR